MLFYYPRDAMLGGISCSLVSVCLFCLCVCHKSVPCRNGWTDRAWKRLSISFAAANQVATLTRVTNERVVTRRVNGSTCGRSVQSSLCAVNTPLRSARGTLWCLWPTCGADVLVLVVRVFAVFVLVADVRHRDAHRRRLARERFLRVWTRVAADWHTFTDIHVANRLHYYSPRIKHTAFEMIQFPSCQFEYLNGYNSPGDNQWATVGQGTK